MLRKKPFWAAVAAVLTALGLVVWGLWPSGNDTQSASSTNDVSSTRTVTPSNVIPSSQPINTGTVPVPQSYVPPTANTLLDSWDKATVDGPIFNCAANTGKPRATYGDANKLTPCWNVSVHLVVNKDRQPGLGRTMNAPSAGVDTVVSPGLYRTKADGSDAWVFTVMHRGGTDYSIDYDNTSVGAMNPDRFAGAGVMTYVKIDGGDWKVAINLNDKTFHKGQVVEVILLVIDKQRPTNTLAPVPFNWDDMQKANYLPRVS